MIRDNEKSEVLLFMIIMKHASSFEMRSRMFMNEKEKTSHKNLI